MAATPIAVNDICESLQKVFVEKCAMYDFSIEECRRVIAVFSAGANMLLDISEDPSKREKYAQFFQNEDEMKMDIPDNLGELE